MKFFLLINVKMPTTVGILTFMSGKNSILGLSEPEKCWISWYFHTYEQLNFYAQLSWAWKKFYNLGAKSPSPAFLQVTPCDVTTANIFDIWNLIGWDRFSCRQNEAICCVTPCGLSCKKGSQRHKAGANFELNWTAWVKLIEYNVFL